MIEIHSISGAPSSSESAMPNAPLLGKRLFLAASLSLLLPGLGQLILGQKRKASAFLFSFCFVIFLYWPFRLPRYYPAWITLILIALGLSILASWDALSSPLTNGSSRTSKWWLLPIALISMLVSTVHSNLALIASGFHIYGIPSSSMDHTLMAGDHIVADLWSYRERSPLPGEIIIFKKNGQLLVKRVIAVSGSTVQGKKGIVIVMGDNRDVSLDSRRPEFGQVEKAAVTGTPLYVYRSEADRIGAILK